MSPVPRRSRRPVRPSRPEGAAGPDRTRTLGVLPPLDGDFGTSWWGAAWVHALESAALDPARLARGRDYAREGFVDQITVTPGRITAPVHGSRARPYLSTVRLQLLADGEWDAFLDAVAREPAHIAGLLDKEMPRGLAEAAEAAGVPLFPQTREIDPDCSCPDYGHPCKHIAALCYQTARFLDADPFVLLLLRGRGERELLDELGRRNAAQAARDARTLRRPYGDSVPAEDGSPEPGTLARAALATSVRPPLPPPLPVPSGPGQPPLLPELPDAPDADALTFLAVDAAHRAHAFLAGDPADPFAALGARHDAVRLAATHPELGARRTFSPLVAQLAEATGHTTVELARAAAAWRHGGRTGLDVLEEEWDPPAGGFDRARSNLMAAGLPRMTIRRNRLTDQYGARQLRYGRDGRWYPYRSDPRNRDDWWPAGPADADPATALRGTFGP